VYDGDYEIIYSNDFNIYENKLVIDNLFSGKQVILNFIKSSDLKPSCSSNVDNKTITFDLTNFSSPLGTGTTDHIPFVETTDNKPLYFSIHVKSLNENTNFKKISLAFYRTKELIQ
jgi:hypothetical protein